MYNDSFRWKNVLVLVEQDNYLKIENYYRTLDVRIFVVLKNVWVHTGKEASSCWFIFQRLQLSANNFSFVSSRKIKFFTVNSFVVFVNTIHLLNIKERIYYLYQRCLFSKRRKQKEMKEMNFFSFCPHWNGHLIDHLTLYILALAVWIYSIFAVNLGSYFFLVVCVYTQKGTKRCCIVYLKNFKWNRI